MASSEGNYHRRGPYFDGTNFASWKHKMKMHILGHNPAFWAIVCVGLQGDFFDGREPNSVKESKLDVLQSQLEKFKMKDGEGVAEMYSRLALLQMRLPA